ncbi:MAG: hypothetical protein ACOYLR_09685, partial [Chlorobium sp.]
MTKWRRADNVADVEHSEHVDAGEILCFGKRLLVKLEFGRMITTNRFDTKQGKLVLCKERPGGVDSKGPLLCCEVAGNIVRLECGLDNANVGIEWWPLSLPGPPSLTFFQNRQPTDSQTRSFRIQVNLRKRESLQSVG